MQPGTQHDAEPMAGCVPGGSCDTGLPCEIGEIQCIGGAEVCVAVGMAAADVACRAAAGPCDVVEYCDGESTICPADALAFTGADCRVGEESGSCTGLSADCILGCAAGTPCDTGRACERGEIDCSTGEPQCVAVGVKGQGTECRAQNGDCDVAEVCDGINPTCPGDGFAGSEVTCRQAVGDCDVAETCNGTSKSCPADANAPNGTPCGPDDGCFRYSCSSGSCQQSRSCGSGQHCCPEGCKPDHLECI